MSYEYYHDIVPHPYTYLPAVTFKVNDAIEWYDLETGERLPPFFGYGEAAEKMVAEWHQTQPFTLKG